MSSISEAYIHCDRCSSRFRCPFPIPDTETFSYAILWGMRVKCRACEVTIECDATNMSYTCELSALPSRAEYRVRPQKVADVLG